MRIVGRNDEWEELEHYTHSGNPEFLVVYGRRRVGKTYLIREFYRDDFFFSHTGLSHGDTSVQLAEFNKSLCRYGYDEVQNISDWFVAFDILRELIEKSSIERKVLFIDELPWMDCQKSSLLSALEHFWNGWASGRKDVILIVCGSATSWIVNKLIRNKGGLYNRITGRIRLEPFTLRECEEYYREANISFSRYQMVESYMIFGGVPYYLSLMRKGLGLSQNVDRLCFRDGGVLRDEYELLYASLFKNAENHTRVVEVLAQKTGGMTREELLNKSRMNDGGGFTRILRELELSGFIRKYNSFGKKKKDALFQLTDFFSLFHLRFIRGNDNADKSFWSNFIDHGSRRAWAGYTFELVALAHIDQIKNKLRIGGVLTKQYSWRSALSDPGVQIDLVIDRNDDTINLCEVKYGKDEFEIDAGYDKRLRRMAEVFRRETGVKSALHTTLITTYGLAKNKYTDTVQSVITMEDLFAL
jgi:hypothetical protein